MYSLDYSALGTIRVVKFGSFLSLLNLETLKHAADVLVGGFLLETMSEL